MARCERCGMGPNHCACGFCGLSQESTVGVTEEGFEVEIGEVQTMGAEMLCEYARVQGLPSTGDQAEDFRRVTRLLGIAAMKALPAPTELQKMLLRQAMAEG